jgi:hypothetical protein
MRTLQDLGDLTGRRVLVKTVAVGKQLPGVEVLVDRETPRRAVAAEVAG